MTKLELAIEMLRRYPEERQEEILEAAAMPAISAHPEWVADFEPILQILRAS